MNRSQQIQKLTDASAALSGVLNRLRQQETSAGEGAKTAHASESAALANSSDREILSTISTTIQEVSETL